MSCVDGPLTTMGVVGTPLSGAVSVQGGVPERN